MYVCTVCTQVKYLNYVWIILFALWWARKPARKPCYRSSLHITLALSMMSIVDEVMYADWNRVSTIPRRSVYWTGKLSKVDPWMIPKSMQNQFKIDAIWEHYKRPIRNRYHMRIRGVSLESKVFLHEFLFVLKGLRKLGITAVGGYEHSFIHIIDGIGCLRARRGRTEVV